MYLFLFLVWVIFNGKLTVEIALFGVVISGVIYAFMCKFFDYSVEKDKKICSLIPLGIKYLAVLVAEIVKANLDVLKRVYSSRYQIEPITVTFQSPVKSGFAQVVLANSITLTPGTITVSLEDNVFMVHCLDKDLAEGIDASVFVTQLQVMEERLGITRKEDQA